MATKVPDVRSRSRILDLLKREGPQDARSLAARLDVSAMAVRQHLYRLQSEKLVGYEEQARPIGRPAKLWSLTEAADRLFPDAHAALAVDLVTSMVDAFGAKGLEKLVTIRAQQQIAAYRTKLPKRASLRRRVEKLAELRTEEGYMAEALAEPDGAFLLVENHCPICAAATACNGLCTAELDVFRSALGSDIEIQRTEHLLEGARRCAYRIEKTAR